MSADPYVYPGTTVLQNIRGLRDQAGLSRLEDAVSALALAELADRHLPGSYDLAHLQAFHRFIFGDLYPWAGQVRTITISKDESVFCLPQYIDGYAADIAARLAGQDHLTGRDRPEFLDGLAELWADLNALHPFREGNGRATRALLTQLARDAGHPISWQDLDPTALTTASITAQRGDTTAMRGLLDRHVRTPAPPEQGEQLPASDGAALRASFPTTLTDLRSGPTANPTGARPPKTPPAGQTRGRGR